MVAANLILFALNYLFLLAAAENTWQKGSLAKVTSALGVYSTAGNQVSVAIMDNALGAGVIESNDYAATGTFYGPAGAMNMDITFTSNNQVSALVGVGGIFVGSSGSNAYTKVQGIHTITQSVEGFGTDGIGATGQFSTGPQFQANGVAASLDAGKTWNMFDIGLNTTMFPARYGSFPSDSTWYVSAGSWPYDEVKDAKRLTARVNIAENMLKTTGSAFSFRSNGPKRVGDESGYTGAVAKTTDGGKTWKQVFDAEGLFYFNQIHCASTDSCMAVGENDDTAFIVGTTNGGESWKTLLTGPAGLSLVAVRMLSETEAWVGGGLQESRSSMMGYYYHTTDAGASWELSKLSGYVFDLSFQGGNGYAAYLDSSYSSVNVYK